MKYRGSDSSDNGSYNPYRPATGTSYQDGSGTMAFFLSGRWPTNKVYRIPRSQVPHPDFAYYGKYPSCPQQYGNGADRAYTPPVHHPIAYNTYTLSFPTAVANSSLFTLHSSLRIQSLRKRRVQRRASRPSLVRPCPASNVPRILLWSSSPRQPPAAGMCHCDSLS